MADDDKEDPAAFGRRLAHETNVEAVLGESARDQARTYVIGIVIKMLIEKGLLNREEIAAELLRFSDDAMQMSGTAHMEAAQAIELIIKFIGGRPKGQ